MPDATDKPDLSFITTEAMVDELLDRCDIALICLMRTRTKRTADQCIRWRDLAGAIGLADMAKHQILNDWYKHYMEGNTDACEDF